MESSITSQFVTYSVARLVADRGFNLPCLYVFNEKEELEESGHTVATKERLAASAMLAPMWSQVTEWLRNTHHLYVRPDHHPNKKEWGVSVCDLRWNGKEYVNNMDKRDRELGRPTYKTYNEALTIGIVEAISKI